MKKTNELIEAITSPDFTEIFLKEIPSDFFGHAEGEITLRELSTCVHDDDSYHTIYELPGNVFLHVDSGNNQIHAEKAESVINYLRGWDWSEYHSFEDLLASFEISPEIKESKEDHSGAFRIWVERFYSKGTSGAPKDGSMIDENGNLETYNTWEEAMEKVEETEYNDRGYRSEMDPVGYYLLSHGEYAPRRLTIIEA